jgi:hypothetical protein
MSFSHKVLPVASFSPAPGLFVSRTGNQVTINGTMELSGPAATPAKALLVQQSINSTWTKSFDGGFLVFCHVVVRYRPPDSKPGFAAQIEVEKAGAETPRTRLGGPPSIFLNAKDDDFAWNVTHEFGHVIGLGDKYTEGILSRLVARVGWLKSLHLRRNTPPNPGYESNLMATRGGRLERSNVQDLLLEEPVPWFNGDDDGHLIEWINVLPLTAITPVSTANKVKIIDVLMMGYVSDADVAAIAKICRSVTSGIEGDAIRHGVDPSRLTSIGQRTTIRIALDSMPHSMPHLHSGRAATGASSSSTAPAHSHQPAKSKPGHPVPIAPLR